MDEATNESNTPPAMGEGGVYYKAEDEHPALATGNDRRGHLFCGFACDMRRSVIIVNAINIALLLISTSLLYFLPQEVEEEDDVVSAETEQELLRNNTLGVVLPALALSALGIQGAWKFEYLSVFLAGLFHGTNIVFDLIIMNWGGAILGIIYCYPHVMLCREIQNGIMTPENYHNEDHCFCCV